MMMGTRNHARDYRGCTILFGSVPCGGLTVLSYATDAMIRTRTISHAPSRLYAQYCWLQIEGPGSVLGRIQPSTLRTCSHNSNQ